MWPDRRLADLFKIEHPLVLAPMVGFGTVGLAAAVCSAGGLGSIGCATMQPELAATTIEELRALTSKPVNVNFFCHATAKADADRENAWHDRLSPYYREFGIDPGPPPSRLDLAQPDGSRCRFDLGRCAGFSIAHGGTAAAAGQGGAAGQQRRRSGRVRPRRWPGRSRLGR